MLLVEKAEKGRLFKKPLLDATGKSKNEKEK